MATTSTFSSGTNQIAPLILPDGSGIDLSGGDVRHFSAEDAFTAEAIAQTTRQLAYRDSETRDKVNEIITVVNNKEQFINLPAIRTTLPPGANVVATNFRIPVGFEARIINAIVSPSGSGQLDIFHNSNQFGLASGDEVISTSNEFSGGVNFFGTGEFVVKITNNALATRTIAASIVVSLRPVGPQAGGLIGPGAVGPAGPVGPTGATGAQGPTGSTGPAGPSGLRYQSTWNGTQTYTGNAIGSGLPADIVRYSANGSTDFSTYIAIQSNTGTPPPAPPAVDNAYWQAVAVSGDLGAEGPEGPAGPGFYYEGTWNPGLSYAVNDVVRYATAYGSGSVYRTFVAQTATIPTGIAPTTSAGSNWIELFGPAIASIYPIQNPLNITAVTRSPFYTGTTNGPYSGLAAGTLGFTVTETQIANLAILQGFFNVCFAGSITLNLPTIASTGSLGAVNWSTANCAIVVAANGSALITKAGFSPTNPSSSPSLFVAGTTPQDVTIHLSGFQGF